MTCQRHVSVHVCVVSGYRCFRRHLSMTCDCFYRHRVQVRRLTRDDGGVYTCIYKNSVGQTQHVMKLVLEG